MSRRDGTQRSSADLVPTALGNDRHRGGVRILVRVATQRVNGLLARRVVDIGTAFRIRRPAWDGLELDCCRYRSTVSVMPTAPGAALSQARTAIPPTTRTATSAAPTPRTLRTPWPRGRSTLSVVQRPYCSDATSLLTNSSDAGSAGLGRGQGRSTVAPVLSARSGGHRRTAGNPVGARRARDRCCRRGRGRRLIEHRPIRASDAERWTSCGRPCAVRGRGQRWTAPIRTRPVDVVRACA